MNKHNTTNKIKRLLDFVSDSSEMEHSEMTNELKQKGFQLDEIYKHANDIIRNGIQTHIKEELIQK